MECRTAKTLELFCIGYTLHCTVRCRGAVLRGSVLCTTGGGGGGLRKIYEWKWMAAALLCSSGRSSMEAPLFMVLKLPPPLSLSLHAMLPLEPPQSYCLSKRAFTPSSFSSFTVNCYSKRNLQSSLQLLIFVESTLPKAKCFHAAPEMSTNCRI